MVRQLEENIDMLSRAVANEAHEESEKMLAQARAKADAVRQRAEEEAAMQRKEILERAHQDAERIRGQAIATTQLKARTLQLEQREKLLNAVFEKAHKQLPTVQQWTEYPQIANQLLKEALQNLESASAVVHADAATQRILKGQVLTEISQEMHRKVELGEPLSQGTGVIAQSENGHMHYDNTLETRLARMQNSLRSPVYRLLMGESL
ncbi:MAG: V-type ATP synthase subunit E family protein [Anaerolineaceae bacterium]|nr:V-type ATP synthase subunit E family protein [Anaerolineaceae bacterium]